MVVIFCFFLFPPGVLGAKATLTVRIWLFQGTAIQGQPGLGQTEVLPVSSTPEFAELVTLASAPDDEFKAAMIGALLDRENLRTIDDLFLFKQTQREDLPFSGKVFLGRQVAFRVGLSHKIIAPARAVLRVVFSRTKDGVIRPEKDDRTMLRKAYEASLDDDKMALIVDQALEIEFDDPVIVAVPYGDRSYFMIVKLTAGEPEPKRKTSPTVKLPPMSNLVPAPRPVDKVLPSYPDGLRRRAVRGDVGLRIAIDDKGLVQMVQVLSPLHPYLDYAASQALWQWRFEPVLQKGNPVRAAFEYVFTFSPEAYADEITAVEELPATADTDAGKELDEILGACATYCRKLREAALFYICEETIREITHGLVSSDRLAELSLKPRDTTTQVNESPDGQMTGWIVEPAEIVDRRRAERIGYSCDYQMIRRFGEIEERRIVLKANGRKITDRIELLEESRYASLSPIVSALGFLDEDRQPLFRYRIVKEDKLSGRDALIIEAGPKLGDADGVRSARAWLEKGSGRILKCEIEGVPLEGYDDILGEAVLLNIRPYFMRTYEYRMENNGMLLPDRTAVRIEYPSLMRNRRETKSKIDIAYKDFRFFTVETGHDIKEER
ncbi:MAG: hypothetical protein A2W03_15145 [Candidatus Aminicenantes bacterium RBG_16_63_16]|nr:MAG: hypothetical protein A2W03_15145 [Candidatus Aminicenantes bacterium RBG_16_63_16]